MELLGSKIESFLKNLFSYLIAVARLIVWTIVFFFTGLQRTLFMRSEIVSVEFKVTPLRCDMEDVNDTISFVDKLYCENPDLAEAVEEDDLRFLDEDFNEFPTDDEFPPNDEGEEE